VTVLLGFLVAAGLCRRAGGVQLQRPQRRAGGRGARTNELEAAKRRPIMASEETPPFAVRLALVWGLLAGSPGG
jgi:hypothetical protein